MRKTNADMVKEIIDVMFIIAEIDLGYNDIKDRKDNWYDLYTMTKKQQDTFIEWTAKYLRKNRRVPNSTALKQANQLNHMFRLRVAYNEGTTDTE